MKALLAQWPEPGRFWVRALPREWPRPARPWLQLASGELGTVGEVAAGAVPLELLRDDEPAPADLLYLPAVEEELAAERDAAARALAAAGTPLLVQLFPGQASPDYPATVVFDLLPALLAEDWQALATLPAGSAAVWPLVPGLSDEPWQLERGLMALASAGVEVVQPIAVSLDAAAARRLAEGRRDEAFHALFHREARPLRDIARAVHRRGFTPWLPRPAAGPGWPRPGNRQLAGLLAWAGELGLELGREVSWGLGLLRAARWIDATGYDVGALAREGNLAVVTEVGPGSRELAREWAATGEISVLGELQRDYLAEV